MSKVTAKADQIKALEQEDLDLIDDALEDEGKDDTELWDELDAAESGAGADTAADDESAAVSGKAAAAAASGDDDDPGKTADDKSAADQSDGKPSDEQAADQSDPWETATEEQRAAYDAAQAQIKKLEQSDRSQRGRLAGMQRRINEIGGHIAPHKPAAASAAAGDEGKTGDDKDFLASDDWKSFQGEYPEVAKPMLNLVSDLRGEITLLRKEQDAIGADRHLDATNEQTEILEEEYPDWEEVMADEGLLPWLDSQPRHIQEAAIRNAEEIVDAAEAADVVGRFKATRSAQEDDGSSTGTLDAENTGKGDGTTRLAGKRKRQLEAASTTRTGGPGAAHGIPEDGDPEKIWDAFDKQEQRQAQRA